MHNRTLLPIQLLLFGLLVALHMGGVAAAPIEAKLPRNPVAANESFELIYQAAANPDGDPDWGPVQQHFDILSQSQSRSIQIINGRTESSIRWNLTLLARETGEFRIPPIAFGSQRSEAVTVQVEAAAQGADSAAAQDIFLKVELEPERLYVQQQAILSIRLYRSVNMGDASLTAPEHEDLVIKKLGDDRQFETRVDGRIYAVTERRYAVFPQASGEIRIPPVRFQGEVFERDPGLGRFFGDAFGNRGFGKVKRLVSEPIVLEVRPIPHDAGDGAWLPTNNLQLVETWAGDEAPEFHVGEPVTRTLMLFADGLTSAQLPPILIQLGAIP